MQSHDTDKQNNVVSLFAARERPAVTSGTDASSETEQKAAESEKFEDVMTKNARNQERLAKERANANKSVLKSYRIKH